MRKTEELEKFCVSKLEKYTSIKRASEETNARLSGIYESLSKSSRTKTSGGLHWEYI